MKNTKHEKSLKFLPLLFVAVLSGFLIVLVGNYSSANNRTETIAGRPPMFVLQVGISRYANATKWAELRGSRTDVEQMKILLTGERFNIPAGNIRTLLDGDATKRKIFDDFQDHLIKNAREYFEKTRKRDAVVMFQFSGHGSQVPDTDKDEIDSKDETFVTYDSRDEPGKNFDITDDEIYELTKRLNRYTDNIVYILDSCHSGSGTRAAEDVRRVPERKTVPVKMLDLQTRGDGDDKIKDNEQTDLLPPSDDYIVISAAKSEQLAGQKNFFPDKNAQEPIVFGYLSFYLIEELKNARANTTYRELMENVRRKVSADKPSQIPQFEGDGGRFVFGELGSREDNFSRILKADAKTITIKAGAMQGVSTGTILNVYDRTDTDFSASEKIASARVTQVAPDRSVAEIIAPKRAVTTDDKAVVVAPDLGALRLKVSLENDSAKLSADEKTILQNLRRKFTPEKKGESEPRGVDLFEKRKTNRKGESWNVAVLKDDFGKVFPAQNNFPPNAEKTLTPATPVFYLAGKDYIPLYNFYVSTTDERAAEKLEKAMVHLARLRMVEAIANEKSPLKKTVSVKPVRLIKPGCSGGKFTADKFESPELNAAKNAYRFQPNEAFWFEVANGSKKELFVLLLGIGTDGSVTVHFPRSEIYEQQNGVKIAPQSKGIILGENCRDKLLQTTPPAGFEKFKLIVSTEQIKAEDFKYLEMEAVGKSRGDEKSLTSLGDWTAIEIVYEISLPGKN